MLLRTVLTLSCALSISALPAAASADASVAARLDARGIRYVVDEDGDYKVTYSYTDEGRSQLVFVSGATESVEGITIREVFAPAAWVDRDNVDGVKALELLSHSRSQKIGAWEIAGEVLYYVIKVPDSIDAAQLETVLDIAAGTADNKEAEFSGDRDEL